jgi:hypothetical protein
VHTELVQGHGVHLGYTTVSLLMTRAGLAGLPVRKAGKRVPPSRTITDLVERTFHRVRLPAASDQCWRDWDPPGPTPHSWPVKDSPRALDPREPAAHPFPLRRTTCWPPPSEPVNRWG